MDGVDAVINTLVHAFYAAHRVHLPLQALGLPAGGEALQLADKLTAFFDGEEFGGLYRVYQQLQLRQLELPVGKLVATRSAAGGDDIHAVILQRTEIIVDAFALGVHAQFLSRDRMSLIESAWSSSVSRRSRSARYSSFSFCPSLFGILHILYNAFLWKKLKIFSICFILVS